MNDDIYIESGFNLYSCRFCKIGRILQNENENGFCNNCGIMTIVYVHHTPYDEKYYTQRNLINSYTKISHFKKVIEKFQGKGDVYISDSILNKIKKEYENFDNDVNKINTRLILKKLKLLKQYDNVFYINNCLGVKPTLINETDYNTLMNQFQQIESLYDKNKIPNFKSNFFHYYYILYKLCQVNGFNDYLNEIPIVKTQKTINQHEIVFEQICNELGWVYKRYFLCLPINLTKLMEKLNYNQ